MCGRKNCNNFGHYSCSGNKACFYCFRHYRFYRMRDVATKKKKIIPSWDECEILLFVHCHMLLCPICNKKMIWHKDFGEIKDVISLQHNNDHTINFICYGCNAAHGASKLGDAYFKIPYNKKYCPICDRILFKNKFSKETKRKDGLQTKCRKCDSLYHKERKSK